MHCQDLESQIVQYSGLAIAEKDRTTLKPQIVRKEAVKIVKRQAKMELLMLSPTAPNQDLTLIFLALQEIEMNLQTSQSGGT